MTTDQIKHLESIALRIRREILNLSQSGGCFTGASLSLADIVTFLYFHYLNLPSPEAPERDLVFLSKGHDVPALYGALVEKGWLAKERLSNHLKTQDVIYWHPNREIPGVEFHSGSLGHLLSVAMGVAYDLKLEKKTNRVICILGDGELNEGSVWEGLLVASALKLERLWIVIDRNQFQANERTEKLIPLEPLEEKFISFGISTVRVSGHSFNDLSRGFLELEAVSGPRCLIADTLRGKGVPSLEDRADRWFCNFTVTEVADMTQELLHGETAKLSSMDLCVR
ncbi:MAG: transketolase [Proteobacteria bacterium]|nr:transketolase [Pseudomonadota bacterium]NDG26667.1 transketolase [Pseudomonadota bacterium]